MTFGPVAARPPLRRKHEETCGYRLYGPPALCLCQPRARAATETATVKAILQYLHLRGYLAWRQNSRVVMLPGKGGRQAPYRMGGVKGMADVIGCVPCCRQDLARFDPRDCKHGSPAGRFLAIEVKSADGKPTPEQTAFLAAVVRAGGIAFVARSVADVQSHGL